MLKTAFRLYSDCFFFENLLSMWMLVHWRDGVAKDPYRFEFRFSAVAGINYILLPSGRLIPLKFDTNMRFNLFPGPGLSYMHACCVEKEKHFVNLRMLVLTWYRCFFIPVDWVVLSFIPVFFFFLVTDTCF